MSGNQSQRTAASISSTPTVPILLTPDEQASPSTSARPVLNPPSGMTELGKAPQSSGDSVHHPRASSFPSSERLIRDLEAKITDAVARAKTYCAFILGMSPTATFEPPNLVVARASQQVMDVAQGGLDALAALALSTRAPRANLLQDRRYLEQQRRNCALNFLVLRDVDLQPPDVVLAGVDSDADIESRIEKRAEIEKTLVEYRQFVGQTQRALEVANLPGRWDISAGLANNANRLGLKLLAFEWGQVLSLTTYRLLTHKEEVSPLLKDTLDVLIGIVNDNSKVYLGTVSLLISEQVDQQTLPAALEYMENFRHQIDGVAQQLCLIASRELESDAPTWKMVMECADANRGFSKSLADMMERARRAPADPDSLAPASILEPDVDFSANRTEDSPASAGPMSGEVARRAGRGRKQRPLRGASEAAAKGGSAPVDRVGLALDRARLALEKSRFLTRQMAGGDPVEVARSLGQSTETIDLLRRHHTDPMNIAGVLRSTLPKWFGDIKPLRAALDKLDALPSAKRSDPNVSSLRAELAERISVLEAMSDKVTSHEIDDVKQYQFPKEKHLERLLEVDEIASVSPPTMLPSSGADAGTTGTLFEMVITPKPLSNGSPAPALFLHLHTDKPVTARNVSQFKLNDFAAVHVKSAEQRSLGAKWEAMRKELGFDDKVHRGQIGSKLLNRLRRAAEASPRT